jgi:hypothetical protein
MGVAPGGYFLFMNDEKFDPTRDQRESTPNSSGPDGAAGGMGVSSERVGETSGEERTDGLKDTSAHDTPEDAPPEQTAGGEEPQPEGIEPKAGYPRLDPRHEHKPYQP